MIEKIRVDIDCRVELEITPELKKLLDEAEEDVYAVDDQIYDYLRKELYKKGIIKIDKFYNWFSV